MSRYTQTGTCAVCTGAIYRIDVRNFDDPDIPWIHVYSEDMLYYFRHVAEPCTTDYRSIAGTLQEKGEVIQ